MEAEKTNMAQISSNKLAALAVKYTPARKMSFTGNTLRINLSPSAAKQLQSPSKAASKIDKMA